MIGRISTIILTQPMTDTMSVEIKTGRQARDHCVDHWAMVTALRKKMIDTNCCRMAIKFNRQNHLLYPMFVTQI